MKKFILTIGTIFLYISIFRFDIFASSLGVSPAGVNKESIIPGTSFTQTFTISRSEPNKDMYVRLSVDGEKVEEWLDITNGNRILLPEGKKQVPFDVHISVPEQTELGYYEGYVRVQLEANAGEGEIIVVPGVRLDFKLNVSDEVREGYEIRMVDIKDFNENEQLPLTIRIKNTGNISQGPDQINLKIYDINDNFIKEIQKTGLDQTVPAFTMADIEIKINDHELQQSDYFGDIKVIDDENELFDDRITFTVKEPGVLGISDEKQSKKGGYRLLISRILMILGGLLIAGSLYMIIFKREKFLKNDY